MLSCPQDSSFQTPVRVARFLLVAALLLIGLGTQAATAPLQPGGVPAGLNAADWQDIQRQMRERQYQAEAAGDGFFARNPAHGFAVHYRADGSTEVRTGGAEQHPADKAQHITLKPMALGYAGRLEALDGPQQRWADAATVNTQWTPNLREWWVNGEHGVEQWLEVGARPAAGPDKPGPLVLHMALDSSLAASVEGQGAQQHLQLHQGETLIRFEKLLVEDANGRRLPAEMRLDGDAPWGQSLAYVIDDRHAVYPLTIDPTFVQDAYLKASNTGAADFFGVSVAVDGDTLVVGARAEDSGATGVDGDQLDNTVDNAGAAYVFVRNGSSWLPQAYLKASNTGADDNFGAAVAISGDTIVIGARRESSNATGVNGDQANNSLFASGAAYVFVRTGTDWAQQAYLKASNTDEVDEFGFSLAISGDTIVVGTPSEDSAATGVNGDQADNSATNSGAAYVFVRSGSNWAQQAYLKAPNTRAGDGFGGAVALSGDTLVVGAFDEDSAATGVDGDATDDNASNAGAAYVFVRSGDSWAQQAYLKASNTDPGDGFGQAVAASGDTVVVGAWSEDSNAPGVNGNEADNSVSTSGAAYVFVRNGGIWAQQAYLKASNPDQADQFGSAVSLSGDTLVVAAVFEDSGATGVDGNQADNTAFQSGAAYVFGRTGSTWAQQAYLKASNTDSFDGFGVSVAVSGETVVVGALNEDSGAIGINGNQTDDSAASSGAAYTFQLASTPTFTVGGTVSGLFGSGLLLRNNGGDDLAIAADGVFTFATALADGASYAVTVQAQPTGPAQTCTVSNGSGTLAGANVSNVQVDCLTNSTPTFTVGGTVSGLFGSGLLLRNNGGDELAIAADGVFTFATALADGASYAVTVQAQPTGPAQTCTVSNGSGTLAGSNVSNVLVVCVTNITPQPQAPAVVMDVPSLDRWGVVLLMMSLLGLGLLGFRRAV